MDSLAPTVPASTREKNGRNWSDLLTTVTSPDHFKTPKSTYNRILPMRFYNDLVTEKRERKEKTQLQHFLTL